MIIADNSTDTKRDIFGEESNNFFKNLWVEREGGRGGRGEGPKPPFPERVAARKRP